MVSLTMGQTLRGPLGLPVGLISIMLIKIGRPAQGGWCCFLVQAWRERSPGPVGLTLFGGGRLANEPGKMRP